MSILRAVAPFLVAILLANISACATQQQKIDEVASLDKAHFKRTATVKDDSLEVTATITTQAGFEEKRGLLGIVWSDGFLRAFINKKTGYTKYQLYQYIRYQAPTWRLYYTANYEGVDGNPINVDVTQISKDVDCSGSRYSNCTYVEHVAFDVQESLLRKMAELYEARGGNVNSTGDFAAWKYKFKAKQGDDHTDGILAAEAAGLLEAVDDYKRQHGLALSKTKVGPMNPGNYK